MQENQYERITKYGDFSAGAWLVADSKASAMVVSSSPAIKREVEKPNPQSTNPQITQRTGDQPLRQERTGPRTKLGKQRSSQNAVKAGMFSRATLLKGERRAEYESLRLGLRNALQPGDELEDLLVDKLTSLYWRYRRMLVAESAEIRKSSEFLEIDQQRAEKEEAEEISEGWQGLIWGIQNPEVLARCEELLLELRDGIQSNKKGWGRESSILKTIYGEHGKPHLRETLNDVYWNFITTIANTTETQRKTADYATQYEQLTQEVLRQIHVEIDHLKRYRSQREYNKFERIKVEILRQRIPDSQGMDRLLRYETHLSRETDRILNRLERLQRSRKGQPLPAQVDVNIS